MLISGRQIVAAVVASMGRTSIVENNINQTIASAVNGASSGMMFSIPALFILNRQFSDKYAGIIEFNKVLMVLACATGAVVGLAFVIPLRKQMIDFDRLAYPGGIAVATILKSPGAGIQKAMLLIGGAVVSGIFYVCMREVLEALTSLGEAQLKEVKAIVAYQESQIDLAFATGTLLGYSDVDVDPVPLY